MTTAPASKLTMYTKLRFCRRPPSDGERFDAAAEAGGKHRDGPDVGHQERFYVAQHLNLGILKSSTSTACRVKAELTRVPLPPNH